MGDHEENSSLVLPATIISHSDWEHLYATFDTVAHDRPRFDEVLTVMISREEEPEHVAHVAALANSLFGQTVHLHELGAEENFLLIAAALLHDIGWSVTPDGTKHHKYSLQYIIEHPWKTLSVREKTIIANVARYHRKALPDESHPHFHPLSRSDKKTVKILASFLRLADALDRTHLQSVKSVKLKFKSERTLILIKSNLPADAEIEALEKKKDLFEQVFHTTLRAKLL
ncbi:MAG: HD domain-containing protein [Verrucomicrobiota bacterium]|nr:HD domain-containing protein [Verrucomicrobiota bacterium]